MKHEKINEAIDIINQLGFSKKQQNIRSALTLLALLDLKPKDSWAVAKNPMLGITQMMGFFAKHYGKVYAPNSRETVRRHTVHQFLQASLIVPNPDKPNRPTNSGNTVYQMRKESLKLLQKFGTKSWNDALNKYLMTQPQHNESYTTRDNAILVSTPSLKFYLSVGKHNMLIKDIITKFIPKFIKNHILIYVGDTAKKFKYFDESMLTKLGVKIAPHGKMPDVIIYDSKRKWIFIIEAVISHGPINIKRKKELDEMFSKVTVGLVFVTAFSKKDIMKKYVDDISWETEIWVADSPKHMIHFNGERFLGPYK